MAALATDPSVLHLLPRGRARGKIVVLPVPPNAMGRDRNPDRIPRAGYEVAPLAGLSSLPLSTGQPALGSARLLGESTLGAVVVYAVYQALLTALRTEALVRRAHLDRSAQARLIGRSVLGSIQDGAAIGLAFSLLLLVFPWLSLPLGVLSVVGLGKASLDLFHAFWDGLNDLQRGELHDAAFAAGVNLNRFLQGTAQLRFDA